MTLLNDLVFFTFMQLRYPTINSNNGIVNELLACLVFIIIVAALWKLTKMLKMIHN